jgi:hypothetical protein
LLPKETGDGKGWLFHGTHHIASTLILSEGWKDLYRSDLPPEEVHVFFGDVSTAANFAERNMDADSPPCIIAVRTEDVAHALRSDDRYDDWLEDWRANLAAGGTVRTTGDIPMPSMRRLGIDHLGLPLHPNAPRYRQQRIERGGRIHPSDAMAPDDMPIAVLDHEPITQESFISDWIALGEMADGPERAELSSRIFGRM